MTVHDLHVGDKVRCTRTYDSRMAVGMEFTVTLVGEGKYAGWIAIDNGHCNPDPSGFFPGGYWHDRFEKVNA